MPSVRFPIQFEPSYARLSRALLLAPSDSYIELSSERITVRMAWAFRASFPRSAVAHASVSAETAALTRGVHGWAGRWLVNGAAGALLVLELRPEQPARVVGLPVRLRQLRISLADADASAIVGLF